MIPMVLWQLPRGKLPPTLKLTLTLTQTLTLTEGQFSSGAIVRIPIHMYYESSDSLHGRWIYCVRHVRVILRKRWKDFQARLLYTEAATGGVL